MVLLFTALMNVLHHAEQLSWSSMKVRRFSDFEKLHWCKVLHEEFNFQILIHESQFICARQKIVNLILSTVTYVIFQLF